MSDYQQWHVGMKVAFVGYDDFESTGDKTMSPGQVFTIKAIDAFDQGTLGIGADGVDFSLEEDGVYIQIDDSGFWCVASAFRPVQPRKTDISIFRQMLLSQPKEEPSSAVFSDSEVPA